MTKPMNPQARVEDDEICPLCQSSEKTVRLDVAGRMCWSDQWHCQPEVAPIEPVRGERMEAMDNTYPFSELFERSKDDRAFIAGSEVREVIGAYRRCLTELGKAEAKVAALSTRTEGVDGFDEGGGESSLHDLSGISQLVR